MRGGIALIVGLLINPMVQAQAPGNAPAPPSYQVWEFGVFPRPSYRTVLLQIPAVLNELKLTETQKQSLQMRLDRLQETQQKLGLKETNRQKFLEALEPVYREASANFREILKPGQLVRLDQIQIQARGPLAFKLSGSVLLKLDEPELAIRLKLTDDEARRLRAIADEGLAEIEKAATFPIILGPNQGPPTVDSIAKLVVGPEFQASKQKARQAAQTAWEASIGRIEQALTGSQRAAYLQILGPPFDFSRMTRPEDEAASDAVDVGRVLNVGRGGGGGGGQRADPNFETKVAQPAYPSKHPRVLFDEAHHNFHTTTGRYKPFAELIANDGYGVSPNLKGFTRTVLSQGEILIIANALGAEGMGHPDASRSAFTEAESDAVRDWVRDGGSLLLITDHAPFGSAATSLASRFGVDMSKGYTSDPVNSEGGETSLVFTRQGKLLGDHPITRGRDDSERINRVQTFTGQSLKGPVGSVAILRLADSAVDEGDDGKPVSAAGRAQGLAFVCGRGRVVVLGEAAELSAQLVGTEPFGMNVPGLDNRQMALNIMHWLSYLLEP